MSLFKIAVCILRSILVQVLTAAAGSAVATLIGTATSVAAVAAAQGQVERQKITRGTRG